jgi:hypothetical protein
MPYIIQLFWRRDLIQDLRLFGRYVVEYDPTIGSDGSYGLTVSLERGDAQRFPSSERAREYLGRPSPNAVNRATGAREWRPLPQQFHYEIVEV